MNPHREPGASVAAHRVQDLEEQNARLMAQLALKPKVPSGFVRFAAEYRNALEVVAFFLCGGLVLATLAVVAKLTYKLVVWL